MASINMKISSTNVRLGEVRFSYVNVFNRKRTEDGSRGKYGVSVLIPKTNTEAIDTFNYAFENAMKEGVSKKWEGKKPARMNNPLRDGDEERPDDPAYKGCYFFNANTDNQPGIRVKDEIDGLREALDEDDFYSGCYGAVSVTLYPYSVSGNNGVAVGLQNVIKLRDGERLSGGRSADTDFADL